MKVTVLKKNYKKEEKRHDKEYDKENKLHEKRHIVDLGGAIKIGKKKPKNNRCPRAGKPSVGK